MLHTYREFVIRAWQPGDRQAAAQLIGEALQEFGLAWEPEGADRDALAVEHYYRDGAFWVAEQAGTLVATAGFHPIQRGRKAVEIRKMYLMPAARRRGLGRFLLQRLEAEIARRGFEQIWLETATALSGAVAFYESMGYRFPRASDLQPEGHEVSEQNLALQTSCDPAGLIETERCDRIYIKQIA